MGQNEWCSVIPVEDLSRDAGVAFPCQDLLFRDGVRHMMDVAVEQAARRRIFFQGTGVSHEEGIGLSLLLRGRKCCF